MNENCARTMSEQMAQAAKITAEIKQQEAAMNAAIIDAKKKITQKYEPDIVKLKETLKKIDRTIQTTLRQHQAEFIGTEGKPTQENTFGTFGWRDGNDKVSITDPVKLEAFYREKPEERADIGSLTFKPNKEGIKRRMQGGATVPGCNLGGDRRSFYTLKDTEIADKSEG